MSSMLEQREALDSSAGGNPMLRLFWAQSAIRGPTHPFFCAAADCISISDKQTVEVLHPER